MKKITLLLALFAMFNLSAQTVLTENFDAGLSLPAGWTNNDIAGSTNVWTFATGGEAVGYTAPNTIYYDNGGMTDNYALFDSDTYGGGPEEAALESPIFDCSALTSVTLKYNHFFTSGFGGSADVEVYNGSSWVSVASYSATTAFGLENIDVTAELAGVSNAQVRFKWTGDYSWGWAFDTVEVYSCTEIAPPACATVIAPADTATDVATTASVDGLSRVVSFSWNAVPGALSYDFVFDGTTIANVSTPSINITGLDYATAYTWSVAPVNCFGAATGCATWTFTTEDAPPAPTNIDCANATEIACGETINASSVGSTGTQEDSGCTIGANGIWFTFTGTGGDLTVDSTASFDHEMAITSGACGTLVNIDCVDDSTVAETHTFTSVLNETYYVYVANWSSSSTTTGTIDITLTCATPPACTATVVDSSTIVPDCGNSQFSVDVEVSSVGDGTFVTDGLGGMFAVSAGTVTAGPYTDGTSVTLTVEHSDADCDFSLGDFSNTCGPSESCGAYSSSPASTVTDAAPVNDIITVSGTGPEVLSDLDVIVKIDHTFLADLDITLTSPTGTIVELMFDQCGANENMDIRFDDDGAVLACGTPTVGTFTLVNVTGALLSDFNDETFDGDWTLTVVDDAGGDNGTLVQWCLIPTLYTLGVEEVSLNNFTYYPNPVNNSLTLNAQKDIQNVAIYNMLGQEVLRTAPNTVNSEVDMSNLQPGAYFVKVTVENATKTIKVIKK
ncbi:hypothetical protein DI383_13300 [Flavobacteriaceae bacterium LYZ1037]|nr:hypothetical protein DI383_13300 [Flavobacteriaceae bacterium LYZ1037]